jgi:hypothetical protein
MPTIQLLVRAVVRITVAVVRIPVAVVRITQIELGGV